MNKVFLLLLLIVFSNILWADTLSGKTVSTAHVNTASGYYFRTNETMLNPDNCNSTSWYRLNDDTYSKEAFALLLSAKVSAQKVQFFLNGCSGNYPKVDWINIHD